MKKNKFLFGLEKPERNAGMNPAQADFGKEVEDMTGNEPYAVFQTEEEFRNAIEKEIEKRHGTEKPSDNTDDDKKRLISEWQRGAAELKMIVPDFDFSSALKNEVFRKALTSGKSVFEAYSEMTRLPKNPEREELHQNARASRRGTGDAAINPAKLSSEDFKKYINNIKNQ